MARIPDEINKNHEQNITIKTVFMILSNSENPSKVKKLKISPGARNKMGFFVLKSFESSYSLFPEIVEPVRE